MVLFPDRGHQAAQNIRAAKMSKYHPAGIVAPVQGKSKKQIKPHKRR
jgi:hypothetical protein